MVHRIAIWQCSILYLLTLIDLTFKIRLSGIGLSRLPHCISLPIWQLFYLAAQGSLVILGICFEKRGLRMMLAGSA